MAFTAGFTVDPASARAAAAACRAQADFVDDVLSKIDICRLDDFGDCRIGQALTAKFANKIGYFDTGLGPPMVRARDDLRELAIQFDAAADAYERTDQGNGCYFPGAAGGS